MMETIDLSGCAVVELGSRSFWLESQYDPCNRGNHAVTVYEKHGRMNHYYFKTHFFLDENDEIPLETVRNRIREVEMHWQQHDGF